MIMNQNLPLLSSLFDKALFVWIKRDPVFNVQSALEARRRRRRKHVDMVLLQDQEYQR